MKWIDIQGAQLPLNEKYKLNCNSVDWTGEIRLAIVVQLVTNKFIWSASVPALFTSLRTVNVRCRSVAGCCRTVNVASANLRARGRK